MVDPCISTDSYTELRCPEICRDYDRFMINQLISYTELSCPETSREYDTFMINQLI